MESIGFVPMAELKKLNASENAGQWKNKAILKSLTFWERNTIIKVLKNVLEVEEYDNRI